MIKNTLVCNGNVVAVASELAQGLVQGVAQLVTRPPESSFLRRRMVTHRDWPLVRQTCLHQTGVNLNLPSAFTLMMCPAAHGGNLRQDFEPNS